MNEDERNDLVNRSQRQYMKTVHRPTARNQRELARILQHLKAAAADEKAYPRGDLLQSQ